MRTTQQRVLSRPAGRVFSPWLTSPVLGESDRATTVRAAPGFAAPVLTTDPPATVFPGGSPLNEIMPYTRHFAVMMLLAIGVCPMARAGIVGTTGDVRVFGPSSDLRLHARETDSFIQATNERQNVQLIGNLPVDISLPSTVPSAVSLNLSPGVIAAGTSVDVFLLHFDPVSVPQQPLALSGSITFAAPVLGIEVLSASLDATDPSLGLPTTLYATGETLRGLELQVGMVGINTFDGITLSADRKTISVVLSTQLSLDEVRIITAVPEPSTNVLLALGGLAILIFRTSVRRHR